MSWREFIGIVLICAAITPFFFFTLNPQRGAVYEIPIIKDEKGIKAPSWVYRITTYNGKAYLMIELPKGGE